MGVDERRASPFWRVGVERKYSHSFIRYQWTRCARVGIVRCALEAWLVNANRPEFDVGAGEMKW